MTATDILRFVSDIGEVEETDTTTNPWSPRRTHGEARRLNLALFLQESYDKSCPYLLIGEAPGFHGCRVTGIPFTDERTIKENAYFRRHFPRVAEKFSECPEIGATVKEPSAKAIWGAFERVSPEKPPCLWNIFPFHPFDPDKGVWSNRTPTEEEARSGVNWIERFIRILKPKKIVAVGRIAAHHLNAAGIHANRVRHPANGGIPEFLRDLNIIINRQFGVQ